MRAPNKTFRSEIAVFRRHLPLKQSDDPKGIFISEVLDRWEKHADTEEIWKKIQRSSAAENLPLPAIFIARVLSSCNWSETLSNVIPELPALEARSKTLATRRQRENRFTEAGEILSTLGNLIENSKFLTREKKTAARTRFMMQWRNFFRDMCGKPLDRVVAFLTGIAFDEVISEEMVQHTGKVARRRSRESDTRPPR
jgi:hypothetical protein